jgi:hypothetical protein
VVLRRLLRPALWAWPSGDRVNAPATNTSDLGMDMIAEQGMPLRNTILLPYSAGKRDSRKYTESVRVCLYLPWG